MWFCWLKLQYDFVHPHASHSHFEYRVVHYSLFGTTYYRNFYFCRASKCWRFGCVLSVTSHVVKSWIVYFGKSARFSTALSFFLMTSVHYKIVHMHSIIYIIQQFSTSDFFWWLNGVIEILYKTFIILAQSEVKFRARL